MGLLGDLTNVGFDSVQAKIIAQAIGGSGVSATWGSIVGSLSNQTDLQNALNAKQNTLPLGTIDTTHWNIIGNNTAGGVSVSGMYFSDKTLNLSSYSKLYIPITYDLALEWYNDSASATRNIIFRNDEIYPYQNNTISLGRNNNRYKESYINSAYSDTVVVGNLRLGSGSGYNNTNCCFYPVTGNWVFFTGGIPTNAGGGFAPSENNKLSCGHPSYKWNLVYSAGGVNTSDRDQKENIVELESGLDTINKLPIYSFTWKDNKPKYISYGMIAQEVLDKAPELVEVPEGYKEGDGSLGLYTNNVLFLAVKAIQELSAKVTKLEQELKTIKGDNYGN